MDKVMAKWSKLTLAVVTVAVLATVTFVYAAAQSSGSAASGQGRGMGPGGGMGMRMGPGGGMGQGMGLMMLGKLLDKPKFKETLGLSDSQVTKIKSISDSALKSMESSRTKEQGLQKQLRTLVMADKPDRKKIDSLIDQITKLQAANMKKAVHAELDIKAVLTKDQIGKVKSFMEQRGKQGGRGMGMGPGGGRGMGPGGQGDAPQQQ